MSWSINTPTSTTQNVSHTMVHDKGTLVREEQVIFPSGLHTGSTHRIAPGKHEWRFKFVMDPNLPESVEGLPGSCIIYNLAAEIDRGYMSKSLLARKHVRIIRTLSRDLTETIPFPYVRGHYFSPIVTSANISQSNEDTWTDKIKYHIFIPGRYFAFGTSVPVDFTLMPLRKGVRIGKIRMELLERLGLETSKQGEEHFATTLADKVVASTEQNIPANASRQLIEPTSGIADESYHFRAVLPLKKSLNLYRQSVSTEHIKIYHNLKVYVNIHNPDGHISQLCLRNLIHIYISPHTPINDDQSIATPITAIQNPLNPLDDAFDATPPPTYGTHVLDQLYEDIDPSGFISGLTTPSHFLSRAQSSENLAGLFATPAGPNHQSAEPSEAGSNRSSSSVTDASALQLQTRLQALRDRRPSISSVTADTPTAAAPDTSNNNSPHLDSLIFDVVPASPPISNRNSSIFNRRSRAQSLRNSMHLAPPAMTDLVSQHSAPSIQPVFNLEELNRIPSYRTAVRAPPPVNISPDSEGLPSYDFAVGLASSVGGPRTPPTPPSDSDDYNHHGGSSSSNNNNNMFAHTLAAPSPHLDATSRLAPASPPLGAPSSRHCMNSALPDYHEARHPGVGFRPRAPQRAHIRGISVGAVPDNVLRTEADTTQGPRNSVPIGGGSLHGLWGGTRRGSQ